LFSPYGYFEGSTRLIPYVAQNCLTNSDLSLSNPNAVRDFMFVDDTVDAYFKVLGASNRLTCGEIFNVGSGKQTTVGEIVNLITSLTNYKKEPKWNTALPRQSDRAKVWQADIRKIKEKTGWLPTTELPEGLSKTIDWFRSNYN
jgi:nucleoside-diphosphate-sugar epimerase